MVSMETLKDIFAALGFTQIKTILNSGNVIFETEMNDKTVIQKEIELALEKQFGRPIKSLLRSGDELKELVDADPFKGIEVTKDTRFYVTFFTDQHKTTLEDITSAVGKDSKIARLTSKEVCSLIKVNSQKNTTDLMGFMEKRFGKHITTRNWNTVVKLVKT